MITVTAAIIEKDGLILAARRKKGLHLAGYWEFPGGKLEAGETPEECLQRELKEEFSINCTIGPLLGESVFDYGHKIIRLLGYRATHTEGSFKLTDHDEIRWLPVDDFSLLRWAPADIPLVQKLQNSVISKKSLLFYQRNASAYIRETMHLDMDTIREEFINLLPRKSDVLDIGCGSGRDSRVFLDRGFTVTAIDPSPAIAAITSRFLNQKVYIERAQEIRAKEKYGGIWASASLLHIPKSEMAETLKTISTALRAGGILYMSFKRGNRERWDNRKRFFNDYTLQSFTPLLDRLPELIPLNIYEKKAVKSTPDQHWLNIFLRKTSINKPRTEPAHSRR